MKQAQTPLLSVIIPVYNAKKYINECIGSVLKENVQSIEIICVDDGSTDESAVLINAIAASEPRVKFLRQEHSSAGAARNLGLRNAKGEFVHFLDSDDWLCPGIYKRCIQTLRKTKADVCAFQYISYDDSDRKMRKRPCLCGRNRFYSSFREASAFFIYNMVAPWNKMYRRTWLEEKRLRFDEIVCGNDRGFYFRMLAASGTIVLLSDYGVYYREKNAGSLTGSNRYKHFDSLFYAWDSSVKAMEGETTEIRAMLLDCIVKDILNVFRQTPAEYRREVAQILQRRFSETDISCIRSLPVPCTWRNDFEKIRTGAHSCEFSSRSESVLTQAIISCKIWGICGCIIKALTK